MSKLRIRVRNTMTRPLLVNLLLTSSNGPCLYSTQCAPLYGARSGGPHYSMWRETTALSNVSGLPGTGWVEKRREEKRREEKKFLVMKKIWDSRLLLSFLFSDLQ